MAQRRSQLPILMNPRDCEDDPNRFPLALGCDACDDLSVCGGIREASSAFSCLSYCCGKPEACDVVCKRNPDFVARVWEVRGFDLGDIPNASAARRFPTLPHSVPIIYGRSGRRGLFGPATVAVSLYQLVRRDSNEARFSSHAEICEFFGLHEACSIIACGTEEDRPLERWWSAGEHRVLRLLQLSRLGIVGFTTPNFSVFSAMPRWDNLHAIKRIAQAWLEMAQTGVPTALHTNMRTAADCENWKCFLRDHPEIDTISYEFATGAAGQRRGAQHVSWLNKLGEGADRPLKLLARGGLAMFPILRTSFDSVVLLDSTTHVRTVHRMNGQFMDGQVRWAPAPGRPQVSIDQLMVNNSLTMLAAATPRAA